MQKMTFIDLITTSIQILEPSNLFLRFLRFFYNQKMTILIVYRSKD